MPVRRQSRSSHDGICPRPVRCAAQPGGHEPRVRIRGRFQPEAQHVAHKYGDNNAPHVPACGRIQPASVGLVRTTVMAPSCATAAMTGNLGPTGEHRFAPRSCHVFCVVVVVVVVMGAVVAQGHGERGGYGANVHRLHLHYSSSDTGLQKRGLQPKYWLLECGAEQKLSCHVRGSAFFHEVSLAMPTRHGQPAMAQPPSALCLRNLRRWAFCTAAPSQEASQACASVPEMQCPAVSDPNARFPLVRGRCCSHTHAHNHAVAHT